MHNIKMVIELYIILALSMPLALPQGFDNEVVQYLNAIDDPDDLALALIPYLDDSDPDVRLLALIDIILTESKRPEVSQAEKALLNNEPPGQFRDLLELGLQVSSGVTPNGNQTTGSKTAQLPGNATRGPTLTGQPRTTSSALSGNSALGNSAEVSSGQTVNQVISPAGSSNWYKIKANSNGILSVNIANAPKDMRSQVKLYDKNFNLFDEKLATSAGDDLKFERDVPVPGWVYILVLDADGKAHAEPYTLTADFQPVQDSFDPNNVLGDAAEIQLGQAVTAGICPKGESDWYKIKIDSNAILSVSIVDVPEDMRSQIKLYDKNFALFEEKLATSAGDDLKFERDVPVPGWIYMAVYDADGKAHAEPYTLTVA